MSILSEIDVAILAGGLGSRLAPVLPGKQKVVARVKNRPFLEYILQQLDTFGFKKVVICTGYLGNQVQEAFGNHYFNLSLTYSKETSPLGTAGAVHFALPFLKSENILVFNGDTFFNCDLNKFWKFHKKHKADTTILIKKTLDISRYGSVAVDKNSRIIAFEEKKKNGRAGFINGGIYLLRRSLLLKIPKNKAVSFERDMFPRLSANKFYGYKSTGKFIDIGTPESYQKAQNFFPKDLFAKRFVLLDRDGTIIKERDHLTHTNQVELIPSAAKAIKKLRELGLGIIVVTNQSVVGRGDINISGLELIHKKMLTLLSAKGAHIDAIYFCPHKPEDNCLCRKPKIKLIENAVKKHKFDPKLCFVVGDNRADIELGKNIGATTFLVRTGHGKQIEKEVNPEYVVNDLLDTLHVIKQLLHH